LWGSHTIEFLAIGTGVRRSVDDHVVPPRCRDHHGPLMVGPAANRGRPGGGTGGPGFSSDRRTRQTWTSDLSVAEAAACAGVGLVPPIRHGTPVMQLAAAGGQL